MMKRLLRLDKYLFKKLYGLARKYSAIGQAAVLTTRLSSKVFQALYFGAVLMLLLMRDIRIFPFLVGPAAGLVITRRIRHAWKRRRPFVELPVQSLVRHAKDNSFPSMHAMSAFVIGMSVWYIHAVAGGVVLLLAGATGLSRVLVGVHYPLDIVVGAVMGVLIGAGTFVLYFSFLPI
jgi:undecaprenyl-diphosphatase